jgi:hypothetical protein
MLNYNPPNDRRDGPRYVVQLSVKAEWTDPESGKHVVSEGETANVGPQGALVHLRRTLPGVGDRVRLVVHDESGGRIAVVAEVIRLERNPVQPLAALHLLDAPDEWRGLIWEPAAPRYAEPKADEEDEEDDDELEH